MYVDVYVCIDLSVINLSIYLSIDLYLLLRARLPFLDRARELRGVSLTIQPWSLEGKGKGGMMRT